MAKLLGSKFQGFLINALIVVGIMMLVERVDFLRKLVKGA